MARSLDPATLDDPALRGPGAGEAASIVAAYRTVRAALLAYQRAFAAQPGGAVLDGRDIGTVVCPDADAKIYVTARPEVRAQRRFLERQALSVPGDLRGGSGRHQAPRCPRLRAGKAPPCGPRPTPTCWKPRTWI